MTHGDLDEAARQMEKLWARHISLRHMTSGLLLDLVDSRFIHPRHFAPRRLAPDEPGAVTGSPCFACFPAGTCHACLFCVSERQRR